MNITMILVTEVRDPDGIADPDRHNERLVADVGFMTQEELQNVVDRVFAGFNLKGKFVGEDEKEYSIESTFMFKIDGEYKDLQHTLTLLPHRR